MKAACLAILMVLPACQNDDAGNPTSDTTGSEVADTGGTGETTDADATDSNDSAETASGCRTSSECSRQDESCRPPLQASAYNPLCGIDCQVQVECATNEDCDAATPLCLRYLGDCCYASGTPSFACAAACTDNAQCGEGKRCRADQVGCEPIPCNAGFACPAHTTCHPEVMVGAPICLTASCNPLELEHGCVRQTCTSDSDCGGGFCVDERCFDTLGDCQGPVP